MLPICDIQGNVKTLVQDNKYVQSIDATQRYKLINYEYDLISAKVNKIIYQPGKADDQFMHRYEYDAILSHRKNKDIIHQDLFTSLELEMLMEREERYEILKLKNQVLISMLIYQGLTAGEITNIKLSNVDLDNGTIFIKGSSKIASRHLELMPKQYRIIDRYINETRKELISVETNKLLVGKLGTPITVDDVNYIVSTYKPLFPDRNLNAKTIRLSVISNWLNEKHIPLEQVQLMVGHKWISTTARYRLTPMEEQREIINKFHPLNK